MQCFWGPDGKFCLYVRLKPNPDEGILKSGWFYRFKFPLLSITGIRFSLWLRIIFITIYRYGPCAQYTSMSTRFRNDQLKPLLRLLSKCFTHLSRLWMAICRQTRHSYSYTTYRHILSTDTGHWNRMTARTKHLLSPSNLSTAFLLYCTVYATIGNEHRIAVQDVNRIFGGYF